MYIQALRKNGTPYTPEYIETIKIENCLGCGRCFKVCSHDVYRLVDRADLELEDDEYGEEGAMVMTVANPGNCIGCTACGKVCTRSCHVFKPMAA
jgi:Nif-specific ferredoxin III